MSQHPTIFERPADLLWRSEGARAASDMAAFSASLPGLLAGEPGDGHGVLVLPGFLADDLSTLPLREVLRARGYRAEAWRLGTNIGPTPTLWSGAQRKLAELYGATGRTVSLIGQSLGGIFAREIARRFPERVRQVITLGSPYRLTATDPPSVTTVGHLYHALKRLHTDTFTGMGREEDRAVLQMPATSIYSKLDGVVPWQACIDLNNAAAENIEVASSHCGMGFHPAVIRIVLDRLAQPEDAWAPYAGDAAT
jgi:hypothetical protein